MKFRGILTHKLLQRILRQLRKQGIRYSGVEYWNRYYWNEGLYKVCGKVVEVIYTCGIYVAYKCDQLVFSSRAQIKLC